MGFGTNALEHGLYRNNGKENGNYYSVLGLYRDNGEENGNYYSMLGLSGDNGKENGNYYIAYWGYIGITEKKMETTIVCWG